jgi:hypothetical protein
VFSSVTVGFMLGAVRGAEENDPGILASIRSSTLRGQLVRRSVATTVNGRRCRPATGRK